jgi:hypothetical protein
VLLAIALGACAPAEPWLDRTADSAPTSPAVSAIERGAEERPPAGAQLTPTAARAQLPTATPTAGPLPGATVTWPPSDLPLSRDGPWLLGLGADEVLALNPDGTGLTHLNLNGGLDLEADIATGGSEVGAWQAFRTHEQLLLGPNFLLRIFRLPNTEPTFTIPMLFDALAVRAGYPWESGERSTNPDLLAVARSPLLWSPNGRYLAFIGAIDGPSADVYAFDTVSKAVLRLTDGPNRAVLMGWSPDSRWVVHMEATFEHGEDGPEYEPVAVWAADVQGGPATYLYASRGGLGDSEEIVGWGSGSEFVVAERDALGRTGRLAQVDAQTGAFKVLYAGEVSSAAVDPSSGTVAFVPYDPSFFPLGEEPPAAPAPAWAGAEGTVSEGGIYLLRRGRDVPERLEYEEWYSAYESMQWIPELERFFSAWFLTVSFTAEGEVDRVFPEGVVPIASPDGRWLVFRRPGPSPDIAVYTADGDPFYEVTGLNISDVVWKRDSSGFYLFSAEAGLRFFSTSSRSDSVVHPAPGFAGGSLRLVYP